MKTGMVTKRVATRATALRGGERFAGASFFVMATVAVGCHRPSASQSASPTVQSSNPPPVATPVLAPSGHDAGSIGESQTATDSHSRSEDGGATASLARAGGPKERPGVRLQSHGHAVRVSHVQVKGSFVDPNQVIDLYVPIVDGPLASVMAPALTLKALFGVGDDELKGPTTLTSADFEVVYDADRYVTFRVVKEAMGAHPSTEVRTLSFDWRTGKVIGAKAFRQATRNRLLNLQTARVQRAWIDWKKALRAKSKDVEGCGADVADWMDHQDLPKADAQLLRDVFVTAKGLEFPFDFGFPHVIQACSPSVDLTLPWLDAREFVDPKGPLGG